MEYEKDAQGIFTASVNLLQSGKLPPRHPQRLDALEAGECRRWQVVLTPIDRAFDLAAVKPALAAGSPLILAEADLYTIGEGEKSHLTVYSQTPLQGDCLTGVYPEGGSFTLYVKKTGAARYGAVFCGDTPGVYTLDAVNACGYRLQMCLTVRNRWSWYLRKAAQAVLDAPQKATSHAESWYGFYTGYLARKHLPDPARDRAVDQSFAQILPLLYDPITAQPLHQKDRIQNHSSMMGICVDIYDSTGTGAE